MIKIATRTMVAAAALGLVSAPIMVQANTRAGDSGSVYSTDNALPGLGRASDGEGQDEGGINFGTVLLGGAALALIVFGIIEATDDDDRELDASPGT